MGIFMAMFSGGLLAAPWASSSVSRRSPSRRCSVCSCGTVASPSRFWRLAV